MKLYRVSITPTSDFATKLKGDTLFGQFCWAIYYHLGKDRLEELLKDYREQKEPFLVVSDGFTQGYLPKPKMPSIFLDEKSEDKKINRKKVWLTLDDLLNGEYANAKQEKEIGSRDKQDMSLHNSLNYKTFHTGDGFDPYALEVTSLSKKDIYFLLDENQLPFNEFKEVLSLLSDMGYGKKSTIGKGRFEIDKIKEVKVASSSKVFMTLSPFTPKGIVCKSIYYDPFTRFGKFGGERAYKSAFKKPLLLADVASVVEFEKVETHQYLGSAISGLSDNPKYKDTVHQGYSIVLPLKELNYD